MPVARRAPRRLFLLVLPLLLVPIGTLEAQSPPGCTSSEYRQFDFLVGEWTVTLPNGTVAGTNRIESILGGCALQEHWSSARGGDGTSLNLWNAADSTWRQVWVDGSGGLLELSGGLVGESMVLSGTARVAGGSGGTVLNRITWTPNADGTVRQLWESSPDGGTTWATQFDGRYARRP